MSGGRFPSLESYPIPWVNFAPDHNSPIRHNHYMAKQRFTDVRPAIEDMVTQMNVKLCKPSWRERLRRCR